MPKFKLYKILEIKNIDLFKIDCLFDNGEIRRINFEVFFESWNLQNKPDDFRYKLLDWDVFRTVKIENYTLSWEQITKKITLSSGQEFEVSFDLDPVVLFQNSLPL